MTANNSIEGTWKIYKTLCCGRMNKETLGGKKVLVLSNGQYEIKGDGENNAKGVYSVKKDTELGDIIQFGDTSPAMYTLNGDTLIIDRGYMDLATETYIRQ